VPKPGIAWIQFASAEGFENFLNIAQCEVDYEDDDAGVFTFEGEKWGIKYSIDDAAEYLEGDEIKQGPFRDFRVSVSVRFPFAQVEELTRLVRGYANFLAKEAA